MSNTNVSFTLTASDKTQAAFASASNGLTTLKTKADSLLAGGLAGGPVGLATAIIGAGFTAAIKGAIDDLDKLNDASERIGVSVENLSALNFAGKMNGLEFEDMTQALTKLSVKMQEAAAGSKEAGALFKDIGVKVTDSSGKLKSADVVFAEIADRFTEFEDGAGKTALAVDAFGKAGAKLVPVLNGGAAGLEKMRIEAASLGGIISDKLAKQAAEFNDNMDRLAVLSGSVAKTVVADLIPSLNKLAAEFIAARGAGMGFWESLTGIGLSDPTKSAGQQIKSLTDDIDKLTASRNAAMESNKADGGSIDTGDMEAQIARLTRRREYFKAIQRMEALEGADANYGNEGRGRTAAGGKGVIKRTPAGDDKKAAKETAEASAEAIAYGKAMESLAKLTDDAAASQLDLSKSQKTLLELMSAPQWADMPETWKQTAIAQFESAHAAELAADQQKRLNELLGATDAAKIEEAAKDMELLAAALEKGTINAGQFIEAANARLSEGSDKIREQKSLVEELGLTFSSAFEDAIAGGKGFSAVLAGIAQDISKILVRKGITEPLGNAFMGLFEKNALGGVYSSPSLSAYSGGVYSSPQLFKFAHGAGVFGEAGPEAIMPLKRGPDGSLGVRAAGGGISVVINNNGTPQNVTGQREVVDSRGRRSLVLEMEDAMAAGVQRPGSRLNRALSAPRMISR